jgi:4-hydroxyacetophenone monooxygenase
MHGQESEPIDADDAVLRDAASYADPSLLAALALATGDVRLVDGSLRPGPASSFDPAGAWRPEQQSAAQQAVFRALQRLRDRGQSEAPTPTPTPSDLRQLIEFAVGGPVLDEHLGLLEEELAVTDLRAPQWRKDEIAPDRPFSVAIVGAGMSGIAAAIRLGQAGVPYVVLEKNADVGGTWFENQYPGCRVDIPNHLYSYTFAQRNDWVQHYSSQRVLLDYFRDCVEEFDVRPHVRFDTEVAGATYDEAESVWRLHLRSPQGDETMAVQALVVAVGQLNRPQLPNIGGRDDFAGPSFHSARWDSSVDLTDKRVAVIGSAASAVQLCPIVAEQASHLTIFQRTPNWLLPSANYHDDVPAGLRWLFAHVPGYSQWYRFALFFRMSEGLLPTAVVEPDWEPKNRSVGAANDFLRAMLTDYLVGQLDDRPDLAEKVVPRYPPASKRMLVDSGTWLATLRRDDVDLETDAITRITATGVVTTDGHGADTEHLCDVIIYATGFQASQFLTPMHILGRDGVDLHEQWRGDARAYLGMTIPGFPNLFCLYGPNTNIVVHGSIIFFSECAVRYVTECIRTLLDDGLATIEVRPEVHAAFNERVDAANKMMAWGVATVNSWYRNENGRVAQNWPFSLIEYWQRTRTPALDEFAVRRVSGRR